MHFAASTIRVLFALIWLWAGVAKLLDPTAFSLAIRNFDLVPDPWVAALALWLPPLECVAALAVILRRGTAGGLAILWSALLIFTLAIIISWARGLDITCGCFGGGDSAVNYPLKLAQNIALLAVGGWLWWMEAGKPKAESAQTRETPAHR